MNLYFMKDEALTYFKENLSHYYKNYLLEFPDWINENYNGNNPLEKFKLSIPDFNLDINEENISLQDCNNVKILYENMKEISNTQATDERLWAGLSHSIFWKYLQHRTKINEGKIEQDKILFSYFFKKSGKRTLVINPLTRLWWVGRQIYDSSNKDNPFYALEFLKRDFGTKVLNLFSYNYTNNPKITRAILVALTEIEKENDIVIVRSNYLKVLKYLNMLGGIIILDSLDEQEIIERIKKYYYKNIKINQKLIK